MGRLTTHPMGQNKSACVLCDGCPPPQLPPPLQLMMTCGERRICGKEPLRRMEIRSLRAEVVPIAQQEPQSIPHKNVWSNYGKQITKCSKMKAFPNYYMHVHVRTSLTRTSMGTHTTGLHTHTHTHTHTQTHTHTCTRVSEMCASNWSLN